MKNENAFDGFDETLTQAEKDAETFVEWPDETIARAVRTVAKALHDDMGNLAIMQIGAASVLIGIAKKSNAEKLDIKLGDAEIRVRIGEEVCGSSGYSEYCLRKALEFYAKAENWRSPSEGFVLQYDPELSPINKDRGEMARAACEHAKQN